MCVSVCLHVFLSTYGDQKRAADSPGAEVIGNCEPTNLSVENQSCVFYKRNVGS